MPVTRTRGTTCGQRNPCGSFNPGADRSPRRGIRHVSELLHWPWNDVPANRACVTTYEARWRSAYGRPASDGPDRRGCKPCKHRPCNVLRNRVVVSGANTLGSRIRWSSRAYPTPATGLIEQGRPEPCCSGVRPGSSEGPRSRGISRIRGPRFTRALGSTLMAAVCEAHPRV